MVAVLLYHRQGIAWHIDREPIWNNALEWAAENIRKANIGVKVVYEWVDEPTADPDIPSPVMKDTETGMFSHVGEGERRVSHVEILDKQSGEYTQPQGRIIYK